jgi:hypothetical protein
LSGLKRWRAKSYIINRYIEGSNPSSLGVLDYYK